MNIYKMPAVDFNLSTNFTRQKSNHRTNWRQNCVKIAGFFIFSVLISIISYGFISPGIDDTSASTITNIAGSTSDYYVSLTSNDTISLPVDPDGTIHTVTDTITATSNTGSGYKVFVSMANSNTNGNRLYYNGDTTSSSYLSPTNTTSTDIPTNSWGVSVTTENPSDPTSSNVYTTMPLLGNELLVKNFTSDTPSTTIPITYAAKTDMSINAGTYKGEVIYSALANSPTNTILSTTTAYTTGGGTLTVSTPLMNSLSLDKATPTATVTIGGTTCTNPTIAINASTGIYEVSCTIPAKSAGSYSVVVNYTGLQDGSSASYTASSQLTYITPAISSISPATLSSTGGETLTIITNIPSTATDPITVSSITLGGTACTSPTLTTSGGFKAITCTTPAKSAGTYDLTANITLNGVSTAITKTGVQVIAPYTPPSITDVQPNTFIDPNGGEIITIITNAKANVSTTAFTVSSVTVGGTACTNPTVTTSPYGTDSTSYRVIVCTAPAKSAGTYNVVANITDTTTGNTATLTKASAVTYATVKFGNITTMQAMTSSVCNAVSTGTTGALKDTRDNQIYRVFKALDGNCWMSENLRYGAMPETADSPTARPYNSADAAKSNNMNTTNMANLTTFRICTTRANCKTADGSYNMFSSSGDNYNMPYIMIYQANTSATIDGQTKYGVLYNYCAVTGGTVCNDSPMSTDAPGSVCPKGWKLPGMTGDPTGSSTGTTDGSVKTYDNVFNLYGVTDDSVGFNKIIASPFNFVRSGRAYYGSLVSRSSSGDGYYWSSTKFSSANSAYLLNFGSSYVYRTNFGRFLGNSARCVSG